MDTDAVKARTALMIVAVSRMPCTRSTPRLLELPSQNIERKAKHSVSVQDKGGEQTGIAERDGNQRCVSGGGGLWNMLRTRTIDC
jgi:hypothetical protein